MDAIKDFLSTTGFAMFADNWGQLVMLLVSFVLLYLAIVKKFEPLLLLPIAFGMLLTNLPGAGMYHPELFADGYVHWADFAGHGEGAVTPGLLDYLYLGVKLNIYPCLIFLGVGAMTDFGPLIANPKSLLLGAAAQVGIFTTYLGARLINSVGLENLSFSQLQAAAIGIIGGADGPTSIYTASILAPELLAPIAVAAYSYMALVPVIQPPIMRLLTTEEERKIKMSQLRPVSKTEKIVFPIVITVFVSLLLPSAAPLIGALMLGNLAKEVGSSVSRIADTMSNALINIVTIMLGLSVGSKLACEKFLSGQTLAILCLGLCAFCVGTAGGVLMAKFMNLFCKKENRINPLIGSAGVSAVPMAARVSNKVSLENDPSNYVLMQAMGPNVSGVIGSAVVAGVLYTLCR